MEHLVYELENLNVHQLRKAEHSKKYNSLKDKPYYSKQQTLLANNCFQKMTDDQSQFAPSVLLNADEAEESDEQDFSPISVSSEDDSQNSSEEESDINVNNVTQIESYRSRGGVNVRKLPQRSVKHDVLRCNNLRTSMKPPKISPKTTEKLRPAQIKKLYTNKKLTNFRPTSLETIFEEPQPMRGSEQFRFVGVKKLRRTLVCSDGSKSNKAIVNRRRARIKKNLGRRVTWKKIPLQNFLNYMQSNLNSENEDDSGNNNN